MDRTVVGLSAALQGDQARNQFRHVAADLELAPVLALPRPLGARYAA
jgi:hypothetical protein